MLWYGSRKQTQKPTIKLKNTYNAFLTKNCPRYKPKYSFYKTCVQIYIPSAWSTVFYNNLSNHQSPLKINLYSKYYYVSISLPQIPYITEFDINTSVITLSFPYNYNYTSLYTLSITRLLNSFTKVLFQKIKFRGKGYYLYRNRRNTITPQFGYAHRFYVYGYCVQSKFLSKTSILFFALTQQEITLTCRQVKTLRPINIFTGRGVRFSRDIIYKKAGKISSYR